jgi:non-ribosomal peptide synthetase component F
MKRTAKKYDPEQRIVVRSRAEIPAHFVSEDEEREWWATHELADELLPDEEVIDCLTEQHHVLIRRLRAGEAGVHRHRPVLKRRQA